MIQVAVLASGEGSNARCIFQYFKDHPSIHIKILCSNKADAPVLQKAAAAGIPSLVLSREDLYESEAFINLLKDLHIDWLVLAGFLWKIPENLIAAFPDHIVNIHPALLPKHGGQGMYGIHVHRSVHAAGDLESGITIHRVNRHYDEGNILAQIPVSLEPGESPESIQQKVRDLEWKYYAPILEEIILKQHPEERA